MLFRSAVGLTFSNDTNALNLVGGGLLKSGSAASIGATAAGTIGTLTAGGTSASGTTDLYIYNNANALTINSRIVDTAVSVGSGTANVRLVLAGGGSFVLTNASNAYSGGTVLQTTTLTLNNAASTVVVPAGGLTLNNSTVTMTVGQGQINPTNAPVLNGGSTLTM